MHPCNFMFQIVHLWKKNIAKPLPAMMDQAAGCLGMKGVAKSEGVSGPWWAWASFLF